ncbi:hypothetical protein DFS34DRAFT_515413 [Phlyctochytrium arcticum]|nr:hypothetical protein DFS34DRAFT_515413 [Phlyctochytrium arcticum]
MTDTLKRIFRRSPSGSREDSSRPRKRASNKNVSPMNAPVSPEGYPSPGWAENPANTPSSEVLRPHDGPPESPNEMPRPTPVPPLPGTSPTARGTPIPPPRPTNTPQDSGINQQKKADKNISGGDGQDALAGVVRDMYRSSLDYTGQPQEGTSRQDKTPDKRDEPSKAKKDFSHSEGPSHFNEKVNHLSSLTAVATLRQQIRGTSTARVALEQNLHAQTQSLTEHLDQLLHLEKKHKLELDRAVDALREVYEVRVHKLDDEVRELRQEVALERRRESELDKAVREAKGALEELRREIRRLQDELSQRDSKISMSTLHIQQLTETRDKLAEDLQCQRSRTSSRNAQDYELEQRTPEEWKAELDRITKERDSALVKLARLEEDLPKENKQEEVPGETQPLAIAVPGQAEEQNNLGPVEERESKVQEILPSDVTTEKQDKPGSEENRESKVQEISPSDVTTEEQDKLGSAEKRESKVQEVPPSDVGPVDNHPDRPVGESQNPWDEAFSHQLEDMRDNVKELVARIQKEEIPAKEMRRAAELVSKPCISIYTTRSCSTIVYFSGM